MDDDDVPLDAGCLPLPLDATEAPADSLSADLVSAFLSEEPESPSERLFDPFRLSVR